MSVYHVFGAEVNAGCDGVLDLRFLRARDRHVTDDAPPILNEEILQGRARGITQVVTPAMGGRKTDRAPKD